MSGYFNKIGLAIAISPTAQSLLVTTARLCNLFKAELILVHIGKRTPLEEDQFQQLLQLVDLSQINHKLIWRQGSVAAEILSVCQEKGIDLLIAGALKKENLLQNYVGTVARTIMRKAHCSVWMIQNPISELMPLQNIVVDAEEGPHAEMALQAACKIAQLENASWVHVVRELKLLGLTLSVNEQCNEQEYAESKQGLVREEIEHVERKLARISHEGLKINIKMLSGKSGFELARFAERKKADLLVVSAPKERLMLLDRLFPHDLEYVFANLPCNLLVIKSPRHE